MLKSLIDKFRDDDDGGGGIIDQITGRFKYSLLSVIA